MSLPWLQVIDVNIFAEDPRIMRLKRYDAIIREDQALTHLFMREADISPHRHSSILSDSQRHFDVEEAANTTIFPSRVDLSNL